MEVVETPKSWGSGALCWTRLCSESVGKMVEVEGREGQPGRTVGVAATEDVVMLLAWCFQ